MALAPVAGPGRPVDAREPRANGSGRGGADHGRGTGGYHGAAPATVVALVPDLPPPVQPLAALALFAVAIVVLRAVPNELLALIPPQLRARFSSDPDS